MRYLLPIAVVLALITAVILLAGTHMHNADVAKCHRAFDKMQAANVAIVFLVPTPDDGQVAIVPVTPLQLGVVACGR